jgi:hypothetical protein
VESDVSEFNPKANEFQLPKIPKIKLPDMPDLPAEQRRELDDIQRGLEKAGVTEQVMEWCSDAERAIRPELANIFPGRKIISNSSSEKRPLESCLLATKPTFFFFGCPCCNNAAKLAATADQTALVMFVQTCRCPPAIFLRWLAGVKKRVRRKAKVKPQLAKKMP